MRSCLRLVVFALSFYLCPVLSLLAEQSIDGHWEGAIRVVGMDLRMLVDFKSHEEVLMGTIDIPQQSGKGLRLTNVRYGPPKIHFELPASIGLAVFNGELNGDMISGDFSQAGVKGKFHLQRGKTRKEKAVPNESLPYKEEEVVFYNSDITLAGTLTLPPTAGPHPAVILITGSGPQNRDEELFGFKPFRIIADHFTRSGIAVLRYDDRGVGGSTGSVFQATSEDFAGDVLAALTFLQNRPDMNPKQIGLCGHSEGGLVAPLAASRSNEVALIILMAGTGVTGEKILLAQEELIGRATGATDAEIQKTVDLQKRIFKAVRTGDGWDTLKSDVRQAIRAEIEQLPGNAGEAIEEVDEYVDIAVALQSRELQSPWFKYFLAYNPAPTLEKVTCPVLALFGALDLQVPPERNKGPIVNALQKGCNPDYTVEILPKANHQFQEGKTGSPDEYPNLKKEFVPGFLDLMTNWILERVDVVK